jgi:hypothetical protein
MVAGLTCTVTGSYSLAQSRHRIVEDLDSVWSRIRAGSQHSIAAGLSTPSSHTSTQSLRHGIAGSIHSLRPHAAQRGKGAGPQPNPHMSSRHDREIMARKRPEEPESSRQPAADPLQNTGICGMAGFGSRISASCWLDPFPIIGRPWMQLCYM